jgi:hypothetical protein
VFIVRGNLFPLRLELIHIYAKQFHWSLRAAILKLVKTLPLLPRPGEENALRSPD